MNFVIKSSVIINYTLHNTGRYCVVGLGDGRVMFDELERAVNAKSADDTDRVETFQAHDAAVTGV